jgi:hypothetical protein
MRRWPPARAARLQLVGCGFRRAAKTKKRRSGILPSRCFEQRLALDAALCGGLIRGKGARLRIRHRLAPLPLAAPRGAAFAAPPASPSPECGIEGIPAAEGPHRAASGAAASGRQKASCQPQRRHPCRRASAALVASSIEMEARGGGFMSRRGLAALRSRGGGSQGLILSPVRRVPRPLPLRSARPQARRSTSSVLSGAAGFPAAAWHPAAIGGGIVPPLSRRSPCRSKRRNATFSPPEKGVSPQLFPKN